MMTAKRSLFRVSLICHVGIRTTVCVRSVATPRTVGTDNVGIKRLLKKLQSLQKKR